MKKLFVSLSFLMLTSCAFTYKAPESEDIFGFNSDGFAGQSTTVSDDVTTEVVFGIVLKVISSAGFTLTTTDHASGIISTAPKNIKITPEDANCGTTMGINYLKDKRTHTQVAINVTVNAPEITVIATISGEYMPGSGSQDITLSCVSYGTIEHQLLAQIRKELRSIKLNKIIEQEKKAKEQKTEEENTQQKDVGEADEEATSEDPLLL